MARGIEISKQSFSERTVMLMHKHSVYMMVTPWLYVVQQAILKAWDKIEVVGKRTKSFTKVIQGRKKPITDVFTD